MHLRMYVYVFALYMHYVKYHIQNQPSVTCYDTTLHGMIWYDIVAM